MEERAEMFKSKISKGKECCAARCSNKEYLNDGSKSALHFFHIPKNVLENKKQKEIWCNLIKRKDGKDGFVLSASSVICSAHFLKEDIKISLGTKRWNLITGAKPSIFEWTKPHTIRKPPTVRYPLQPVPQTENNTNASCTNSQSDGESCQEITASEQCQDNNENLFSEQDQGQVNIFYF